MIEVALHQIEPYLISQQPVPDCPQRTIQVNFPDHVLYIKGDLHYLPTAIAFLLYKGRRTTPSLTIQCDQKKPGMIGRIKVEKSSHDTSIGDLFRPGGRSGNRLAIAKLIFERYGSPLITVESDEGYEFEFVLLPGDGFPREHMTVHFSKGESKSLQTG